jgi:hypothetical protein
VGPYKLGLQNPHRQARRACASTRLTKPAHRAMASLHCKVWGLDLHACIVTGLAVPRAQANMAFLVHRNWQLRQIPVQTCRALGTALPGYPMQRGMSWCLAATQRPLTSSVQPPMMPGGSPAAVRHGAKCSTLPAHKALQRCVVQPMTPVVVPCESAAHLPASCNWSITVEFWSRHTMHSWLWPKHIMMLLLVLIMLPLVLLLLPKFLSRASPPSWCSVAGACGSSAAGTPASRAQRPS